MSDDEKKQTTPEIITKDYLESMLKEYQSLVDTNDEENFENNLENVRGLINSFVNNNVSLNADAVVEMKQLVETYLREASDKNLREAANKKIEEIAPETVDESLTEEKQEELLKRIEKITEFAEQNSFYDEKNDRFVYDEGENSDNYVTLRDLDNFWNNRVNEYGYKHKVKRELYSLAESDAILDLSKDPSWDNLSEQEKKNKITHSIKEKIEDYTTQAVILQERVLAGNEAAREVGKNPKKADDVMERWGGKEPTNDECKKARAIIKSGNSYQMSDNVLVNTCAVNFANVKQKLGKFTGKIKEKLKETKLFKKLTNFNEKMTERYPNLWPATRDMVLGMGKTMAIGVAFGPIGLAANSAVTVFKQVRSMRDSAKKNGQSFWQYAADHKFQSFMTGVSMVTATLGATAGIASVGSGQGLGLIGQAFNGSAVADGMQNATSGVGSAVSQTVDIQKIKVTRLLAGIGQGSLSAIHAGLEHYKNTGDLKGAFKVAGAKGLSTAAAVVMSLDTLDSLTGNSVENNLDGITGADPVATTETNSPVTENENVVNTSLHTRAEHIEHDKGPEFAPERAEVVPEPQYEQANETQLDRLFDANPKAVNEILGGEWKNSAELKQMMEDGGFSAEQLEAIHGAARAGFDENGHIIDNKLEGTYEELNAGNNTGIQTESVEVGKTIQINVGSNGDGVYEVVGKEGFNTQVERGYHSEANGSKFDVVKVVYTNDATGEKEVVYVGPEGPMSKETFDSQGRALECFDIKSGEEVLIHKTEYDDSNNTVTRTSYEGENVTRIVKQENTDTAEINYRDNDGDGKTDVTASYSKIDNTATFETETSKVIINDDMNEIKVIRDGKIYVNKLDDSATFEQRNEWYDMTKNLNKNPDAKLSEGFSEVPNEVQELLDIAKEKSEETGEQMDIAGAIRQKAYEDEVAKFNIFEEKTDLVDIMEEAYENVVKSKPYLNENTGLIEMVESGKVFVGIDGDGDGQADSFIPKDKDGCTTKIEYEHDEDGGNLQKATITHTNAETGEKEVIVLSKEGTRTTCYDGEGHRTSYIEKNSEQTTTSNYEGDKLVSVEKDDNTGKTVDKYEEGKLVSRHVESKVSGEIQDQKFDESGEITSLEIIRGDIRIDKHYEDGNVTSETETDMKTGVEITKIYEEGEVKEISEYDPNKGVIIGTKGDTKTETYLNENKTLNYEKNGEEYKLVSTITKDGVEEITTYHNHNDMQVTEENGHIKQVVYGNSTAYADGKGNIYKVEIQHVDGGKTVIEQNGTPRFFNDEGHVILNANNHMNFRGVTGSYVEKQGMSCNNVDETPFKPGTSIKNVVDNIVTPRDVSQSTNRTSYSHGTAYKGMA